MVLVRSVQLIAHKKRYIIILAQEAASPCLRCRGTCPRPQALCRWPPAPAPPPRPSIPAPRRAAKRRRLVGFPPGATPPAVYFLSGASSPGDDTETTRRRVQSAIEVSGDTCDGACGVEGILVPIACVYICRYVVGECAGLLLSRVRVRGGILFRITVRVRTAAYEYLVPAVLLGATSTTTSRN